MFEVEPDLWLQWIAPPWPSALMIVVSRLGVDWFYTLLIVVLALGVRLRPDLA